MAYFNPEEEELQGQPKPDSRVSARPPGQAISPAADPAIAAAIAGRQNSSTRPSDDLASDPLMAQYMKDQSDVDEFRQAKLQADTANNIGQSLSQLALGVNKPQENPVFKNIAAQNKEMLNSKEQDIDRRRKVIDAIETRKARADTADLQAKLLNGYRSQARQDRKEKEATPSDKQTETMTNFDDSIATVEDMVSKLGNHSEWVGPMDGRWPALMASPEQVKFRAAIGKFADQYRKAITGAGASNQEIDRLESRLPKGTDNFNNFLAKAQGLIEEAKQGKQRYLKNLSAQGKNTKPFESAPIDPDMQKAIKGDETKVLNGKTYRKVAGGWEEVE